MDKKLYELQEILEKCGKPNYTSSIPKDIKKNDVLDALCGHQGNIISEINMNNELISLLHNYTALPIECNLQQIEQLLKNYEPVKSNFFDTENVREEETSIGFRTASNKIPKKANGQTEDLDGECNVESYILDRIRNEILESVNNITWDDIVGLNNVKKIINEIVLWPMLRPDLFTGLRGPPKGLLLFGPPGTGKTMIGKCIASQCNATFFSISASSLTSKWVGEGEKMVRALFYLARKMQPSVIFIDEIDSLLTQRSENENEGSRRIKTEFLVQFDGTSTNENDRILVIGATNRPQEIDEAARRRLVKRIYVCLPSDVGRISMIKNLVKSYQNILNENDFREISLLTEGYSGSDMFNLCREASLEPLREIDNIKNFKSEDTRSINVDDFKKAMLQIKKSVSEKDLGIYEEWNNKFGSF